jgi:leader peptidase (prepilin peptidase)/N-methyltransferase
MIILVGTLGAILGSVANALISRLPKDIPWSKGRSVCDFCKHQLSPLDLIPIASFIFLFGKCRYCKKPILVRNLLVEILMSVFFVLGYLSNLSYLGYVIIFASVVIAVMDWEVMLISDKMLWVLGGAVLLSGGDWRGALFGAGFIGGIWLITKKRAMGEGDIFLMGILGYWLGFNKTIMALWWAFVLGAAVSVVLMILKLRTRKDQIAFGPFLLIGAWIAYTWGCGVFCF